MAQEEIGGPVQRVAIVTFRLAPAACYLARRIHELGVEVAIFSQTNIGVPIGSRKHLARLRRTRGWLVTIDYSLWVALRAVALRLKRLALRLTGRRQRDLGGRVQSWSSLAHPPAVRQAVEGIRSEAWLTIKEVENINRSPGQDELAAWAPDVMVLVSSPIVSKKTIEIPSVVTINGHSGITPLYCGSSSNTWPLFEKRFDDIGYTVHVVVPAVDAGPVIHQERVEWDRSRPVQSAMAEIKLRKFDTMVGVVERLARGERIPVTPLENPRSMPPAGLLVSLIAEWRRRRYARRARVGSSG